MNLLGQVLGWNHQRHPLQVMGFAAASGRNSCPSSLKQSSSFASAWWTTPSRGTWHWPCLCASPVCPDGRGNQLRHRAFHEQASAGRGVCPCWGLEGIWELSLQAFASTGRSMIPCFLSKCTLATVMFWALLSPCYYWAEHGGMFHWPCRGKDVRDQGR